jgi:2-methylaconitate cis-trans-isomerase PrpF
MEATVRATTRDDAPEILGVIVSRTARHILDGVVYVDRGLFTTT